jgi:dolichyl-phosphate beta-glucosyltransferase
VTSDKISANRHNLSSRAAQSLAGRTLVSGLIGGACLGIVCVISLTGMPDGEWMNAGLGLFAATVIGFVARGLRRKAWFGSAVTLHQSISFEVVVQAVHWLSPSLSSRAFEKEFLVRETGMDRRDADAWLTSRRLALPVIGCCAASAIWWSVGVTSAATAFLALAGVALWVGMRRLRPTGLVSRAASSHLASTLLGLVVWGIEGCLFVMVTSGLLEPGQSLLLYLGFTIAAEMTVVPLAIGIAELPALLAVGWGIGPTALAVLLLFHGARLTLLLMLGLVYLPRYKLTVDDFLDTWLITRLAASQRPAAGWQFEDDGGITCDLSVVIPAYNEADRLPPYLAAMAGTLQQTLERWEIIVVDDGSTDATAKIVEEFGRWNARVRLIRNATNLGKGGTVARGVLESNGRYVVFADADGATPAPEIRKLLAAMDAGAEIAIGSRSGVGAAAKSSRDSLRAMLGSAFYSLVNFLAVPGIRDTQCGFKGFRRDAAIRIFDDLTETGWAFDVELLYRAQLTGYAVTEVPVEWHEQEGSKLSPFRDAIRMAVAIFNIRKHNAGFLRRSPADQSATALRPVVGKEVSVS